jgi:hypothetical protein
MVKSNVRGHCRFVALFLASRLVIIGSLKLVDSCHDHKGCPESRFCAQSECTDDFGRNFSCGDCKPCAECRCHADAIDHSCPQQRCPDQPTDGVRFLQGPFYSQAPLAGVPTHLCVRRLLFTGGTFSDMQAAVRTDHPASAAPADLPALAALCPSFVRIGAVANTTAREDGSFAVDVFVSSDGCPPATPPDLASMPTACSAD